MEQQEEVKHILGPYSDIRTNPIHKCYEAAKHFGFNLFALHIGIFHWKRGWYPGVCSGSNDMEKTVKTYDEKKVTPCDYRKVYRITSSLKGNHFPTKCYLYDSKYEKNYIK